MHPPGQVLHTAGQVVPAARVPTAGQVVPAARVPTAVRALPVAAAAPTADRAVHREVVPAGLLAGVQVEAVARVDL